MRLYIDTNVPISLVTGEFGKNYEYMEERARRFLAVCAKEEHVLIVSDWMMDELTKVKPYCASWIQDFAAENIIEYVSTEKEDENKARIIQQRLGIHLTDALHTQIALRAKCDYIVTWDRKDFSKVTGLIQVVTPHDFS